ncbi:hypothetical protein [Streptomyces sp. NPDC093225]|uniref:hypothetical protein n=1 Tax=Streptomyces sp. NPDC093225 TaxID=3366034 RepID=UPI0037F8873D
MTTARRTTMTMTTEGHDHDQLRRRTTDLIFDVIAGTVVHLAPVSAELVAGLWVATFTTLLEHGLKGIAAEN